MTKCNTFGYILADWRKWRGFSMFKC